MKTVIENVRVFDGEKMTGPRTVVIENEIISAQTDAADADVVIGGTGCTLLPGLIDSHVHLYEGRKDYMEMAIRCGVTTELDMGIRNPAVVDEYRSLPDLPDMLSSCGVIYAPGSNFAKHMHFPEDMVCGGIDDVERIVDDRLRQGADYIKMIFENSARRDDVGINTDCEFPLDVGRKIVEYSHSRGKKVAAHAVSVSAYRLALDLGVDVIMHMPYTEPMDPALIEELAKSDAMVVPTMAMGDGLMVYIGNQILASIPEGAPKPQLPTLGLALHTMSQFIEGGVKMMAGTDANLDDPTTPADVFYGAALQDELAWYVQAGMSPVEALRITTSAPAKYWGLTDRGVIAPGKRADLLLVEGNPDQDIAAIRNVKAVFKKGECAVG